MTGAPPGTDEREGFAGLQQRIESVLPRLPEQLASEDAIAAIRRLAPSVPAGARTFGFEVRIASDEHRIDLGAAYVRRGLLTPPCDAGTPRREVVETMLERWRMDGSALARWVPFVFLEYDLPARDCPAPTPSVFAALDSPEASSEADAFPERAAAHELAGVLHGGVAPASALARIECCFSALPPQGRILHVAMMTGRPTASLRLSACVPATSAGAYLAHVGLAALPWPFLSRVPGAQTALQIDFDLTPGTTDRYGLLIEPRHELEWTILLGTLVESGLADPEKAGGVLGWGGWVQDRDVSLRLERSHVQLVCRSGEVVGAKAYLGVREASARRAAG